MPGIAWDSLHPMVVHFPIALLLVAPLVVVAALIFRRNARVLLLCGVVLMAIGTAGAFLASATGEAAGEIAEATAARLESQIESHEEMGESLGIVFLGLTLALGIISGAWRRMEKRSYMAPAVLAVFFVLFVAADVQLVRTAHSGGQLVHEFNIHGGALPANRQINQPNANIIRMTINFSALVLSKTRTR